MGSHQSFAFTRAIPPLPPQTLSYVSDGDANGVFYFLGQNYGRTTWVNPYTAGRLAIASADNTGGDVKTTIVDRADNHYSTDAGAPTIRFDLGAGHGLIVTGYSYRYREDWVAPFDFAPINWDLKGSNDGSTQSAIDSQILQTPAASAWVSPVVVGEVTQYRYLHFNQVGNNDSGTGHLSINEFELYGVFYF